MLPECKICLEDINDIITYDGKEFDYCFQCLTHLLDSLWPKYIKDIKQCDCESSLNRLIDTGPPFYFRDNKINDGNDIKEFIYKNEVIDGKTKGSIDIKYKEELIKKLKESDIYTLDIDAILRSFM